VVSKQQTQSTCHQNNAFSVVPVFVSAQSAVNSDRIPVGWRSLVIHDSRQTWGVKTVWLADPSGRAV
jgi:hypothetical protein